MLCPRFPLEVNQLVIEHFVHSSKRPSAAVNILKEVSESVSSMVKRDQMLYTTIHSAEFLAGAKSDMARLEEWIAAGGTGTCLTLVLDWPISDISDSQKQEFVQLIVAKIDLTRIKFFFADDEELGGMFLDQIRVVEAIEKEENNPPLEGSHGDQHVGVPPLLPELLGIGGTPLMIEEVLLVDGPNFKPELYQPKVISLFYMNAYMEDLFPTDTASPNLNTSSQSPEGASPDSAESRRPPRAVPLLINYPDLEELTVVGMRYGEEEPDINNLRSVSLEKLRRLVIGSASHSDEDHQGEPYETKLSLKFLGLLVAPSLQELDIRSFCNVPPESLDLDGDDEAPAIYDLLNVFENLGQPLSQLQLLPDYGQNRDYSTGYLFRRLVKLESLQHVTCLSIPYFNPIPNDIVDFLQSKAVMPSLRHLVVTVKVFEDAPVLVESAKDVVSVMSSMLCIGPNKRRNFKLLTLLFDVDIDHPEPITMTKVQGWLMKRDASLSIDQDSISQLEHAFGGCTFHSPA